MALSPGAFPGGPASWSMAEVQEEHMPENRGRLYQKKERQYQENINEKS